MTSIAQFFQRNQTVRFILKLSLIFSGWVIQCILYLQPPDEAPSTSNRGNSPLPLVRRMDASMEMILDLQMSAIDYNLLYENML